MSDTTETHDELWRHLDWSFWGTGMADTFREPLAEAMLAGITPEQREQANALITRWRDHREFVGRDKYEAQKAEIEQLRAAIARTVQRMEDYNAAARERGEMSARVNASQVINLLSLTWPDGNEAAPTPQPQQAERRSPDRCAYCGHCRGNHDGMQAGRPCLIRAGEGACGCAAWQEPER